MEQTSTAGRCFNNWHAANVALAAKKGFCPEDVTALKFIETCEPSQPNLAVGFSNGRIQLYRVPLSLAALTSLDNLNTHSFQAHRSAVSAIYFDSSLLISGDIDGTIRQFDLRSGSCILSLCGHRAAVTDIDLSPNRDLLASSSAQEGSITFWSVAGSASTALKQVQLASDSDILVRFDPSGRYLFSTSHDSGILIAWDTQLKQKLCEGQTIGRAADDLILNYSSSSNRIYTVDFSGYAAEWTFASNGQFSFTLEAEIDFSSLLKRHFSDKRSPIVFLNPSQGVAAVGCSDGTIRVLELDFYSDDTSQMQRFLYELSPAHTNGPVAVLTGGAGQLISLGWDNRVHVFHFAGRCVKAMTSEERRNAYASHLPPAGEAPSDDASVLTPVKPTDKSKRVKKVKPKSRSTKLAPVQGSTLEDEDRFTKFIALLCLAIIAAGFLFHFAGPKLVV